MPVYVCHEGQTVNLAGQVSDILVLDYCYYKARGQSGHAFEIFITESDNKNERQKRIRTVARDVFKTEDSSHETTYS